MIQDEDTSDSEAESVYSKVSSRSNSALKDIKLQVGDNQGCSPCCSHYRRPDTSLCYCQMPKTNSWMLTQITCAELLSEGLCDTKKHAGG